MVRFLFNYKLKLPGMILFFISLIGGIFYLFYEFKPSFLDWPAFSILGVEGFLGMGETNNMTDEILSLGLIIGAILTGFSKEKVEDEYINKIRMESLVWAFYVNSAILILAIILISGLSFFNVMVYNMFTSLIFFVFRFNIVLRIKSKEKYEE